MTRPLRVALGVGALGALAAAVVASGVVSVSASGGHWAITERLLDFAMERSVATHSRSIEVPPLGDAALIRRGAVHYELGCRVCHGSPLEPGSRVARSMLPRPPMLEHEVSEWSAAELFYIVKHGIKFTGMPAWPSRVRDDEVWAVVAFLEVLPRLDARSYRALIEPDASPDATSALLLRCARCHGADGRGRDGVAPSLAGQREAYLVASLDAYSLGARHSGIMQPIAAELEPDEVRALAAHYAALPAAPHGARGGRASIARGERIAVGGVPSRRVAACGPCHGAGSNAVYPTLAGQHSSWIALQLSLFRAGTRGGTPFARVMARAAHDLDADEARDVARYYAALTERDWNADPTRRPR